MSRTKDTIKEPRDPSPAEHNSGVRRFLHGGPEADMIGANLKAWRKQAKLSQEQAAVAVGMKLVKLQRVERGEARLDVTELASLSALYGRDFGKVLSAEQQGEPDFRHVPKIIAFMHPALPLTMRSDPRVRAIFDAIAELNGTRK